MIANYDTTEALAEVAARDRQSAASSSNRKRPRSLNPMSNTFDLEQSFDTDRWLCEDEIKVEIGDDSDTPSNHSSKPPAGERERSSQKMVSRKEDSQIFGDFVAMQMRRIDNENHARRIERNIQQIFIDYFDQQDTI